MAQPQRESTRKVLAAEAIAQMVIGQAVDRAVTHANTLGLAPSHATLLVQASASLAIAKSRETAAQASALQFEKQTGLDAAEPDDNAEAHAQRAANGLAKAFHEEMQGQFVAGLTTTAAYVATAKALKPNIERTATTEVMDAWNGETRRQARIASVEIEQTWHAEGDACPICAQFDGQTVRGNEQFEEGDPPLHPHCKCEISSSVARREEVMEAPTHKTAKREESKPEPKSAPNPLPIKREPVRFADLKSLAVPQDVEGFGRLSEAQFTKRMNAIVETMSPAQREAVGEFTGSTYGEIRRIQRLDEAGIAKFIDAWGEENYAEMRAQADALDALHTPERVMPGTVYRGIRGLTPDVFEEILQQDEVLFAGTSSTSRSPSAVMNEFIDTKSETRHSVLFVIHQETAVPVEALGVDREKEFLVRNNTKFRVLNRSRLEGASNTLILEVKEVP